MIRNLRFIIFLALVSVSAAVLSPAVAQHRDGLPPTTHVLPATYIQSVFLKFLLSSYGPDKTAIDKLASLTAAQDAILRFTSQPRLVLKIESVAELESIKARYFPPFLNLSDEIEHRSRATVPPYFVLTTTNSEVEAELERLQLEYDARYGTLAGQTMNSGQDSIRLRSIMYEFLNNPQGTRAALDQIPNVAKLAAIDQIHAQYAMVIQKIESTGQLMAQSGQLRMTTPGWQRFFEITLGEYFKNLDLSSKRDIVSSLIDLGESTDRQRFEIMVQGAGPQFQKLFQVYARQDGFGDDLRAVFKSLEQNVRPVPFRLVRQIIDAQPVPFTWVKIDESPIGVGTMAQVHRAEIQQANGQSKTVVVRIMKPGIAERLASDSEALAKVAPMIDSEPALRLENFPRMTPFLREIDEMTRRELEVPRTVANQIRAASIYSHKVENQTGAFTGSIEFRVPSVIDLGPTSQVMVQEFVEGTSFEKFARREPLLAVAAAEELSKLWAEKALVGEGFYHSDLHQGNVRVRRENNRVVVNILDFGMTGQLSSELQNRFLAFGMISSTRDPAKIARVLWEISLQDQNSITQAQLLEVFRTELERKARERLPDWPFYEWAILAANSGIKFPSEFTSLNRGFVLIQQMLAANESKLELATLVRDILRKNPGKLFAVTGSTSAMSRWEWTRLIWRESGSTSPASDSPVRGAARAGLTCEDLFRPVR